jgi:polyisoprenyl-phosphate glycosyltransferase
MQAVRIEPLLVSVVVPCYNEEAVIEHTHRELRDHLQKLPCDWEILYVDDGSKDATLSILTRIQSHDPNVRVVGLSRNFGHQYAVTAGIDLAAGDAVVLIDADLQDPPEVIHTMFALWQQGFHVVYGQREQRAGESTFKRLTAATFYRLLNKTSEIPIPLDTGDFRLMDRKVVDVLKQMPEEDRFLRGMVSWVGFNQCPVRYARAQRFAGETHYPFRKMVKFALDGMLSFSAKPLRLATSLGFATSLLAFLGICYALFVRLFTQQWVSGWAFLMIAVLLMGGVQLICIGIMGEYVGRVYGEGKRRPLYLVQHALGFPQAKRTNGHAEARPRSKGDQHDAASIR